MKATALVLGTALVVLLVRAPIPRMKVEGKVYYPTTRGSKWVYDCEGEDRIEVISDVEEKGEAVLVTLGWEIRPGKVETVARLLVSTKGVFRVESLGGKIAPPQPLLQLPYKKDAMWNWTSAESKDTTWSYHAQGLERVKVPAGTFDTIRIDTEWTVNGGDSQQSSDWFAPNVGIVKRKYGGKTVKILKSFTSGK